MNQSSSSLLYKRLLRFMRDDRKNARTYCIGLRLNRAILYRKFADRLLYEANEEDYKTKLTMNNITIGIVLSHNDIIYQMRLEEGTTEQIPVKTMHFVKYPKTMTDELGFLKPGTQITLYERMSNNGDKRLLYPDHSTYRVMEVNVVEQSMEAQPNIPLFSNLLERDCNTPQDLERLLLTYISCKNDFTEDIHRQVAAIIIRNDRVAACNLLRGILHESIFPQEDAFNEYKTSFLKSPIPCMDEQEQRKMQFKNIVKELLAFANSGHQGTLLVGVTDNGDICGIEKEITEFNPAFNIEKFESMFRNVIKQLTNTAFLCSLDIQWEKIDGHIICRIQVPVWDGDVLLLNGMELHVRTGASVHQLKGNDLINFIRSKQMRIHAANCA